MLQIVLYQPEIPPNTGNIMRLCANIGAELHLIEPLGFRLDEKRLRRAGLDYRDWINVSSHENLETYLKQGKPARVFACSTRGSQAYSEAAYQENDALMFGPETRGLPQELLDSLPKAQRIRIPMLADSRSLNLSNAVAVIAYEAWRQLGFSGSGK